MPERATPAAALLPQLRGALSRAAEASGARRRWLLALRDTPLTRAVVDDQRLADWVQRGVATPDHVIRTKARPLLLAADASPAAIEAALEAYTAEYRSYFQRQNARVGGHKTMLDPLPRLIAVPGLGLIGVGKSAAEAAVTADIGEAWASTLLAAESIGRFQPVGEDDTFDMEYWSLEQAKLGKGTEKPLARQVVLVTGGAGAIGAATARAFAAQGAELALLDLDGEAVRAAAAACGPRALGLACDVTDGEQVRDAIARVCEQFGGLDVVVSNAGAAWTGAIASLAEADLRAAFELNFFAHQSVAQAAVALWRLQDGAGGGPDSRGAGGSGAGGAQPPAPLGGQLLFNVSKQALNPGPNFGAYGLSKAALLALVRQYALEEGENGIRVNAINADRIRSGLLDTTMIRERAAARGVSEEVYMAGNLLGQEVLASDVADGFVALAQLQRSTGAVLTVDGGNVAAMVR